MSEYATEWTGCWPCLCAGEWRLYKDGDILDVDIPFQESPAYTFGEYYELLCIPRKRLAAQFLRRVYLKCGLVQKIKRKPMTRLLQTH